MYVGNEIESYLQKLSAPRKCSGCRAVTVEGYYLCNGCAAVQTAYEHNDRYEAAIGSMPAKFRTLDRSEAGQHVRYSPKTIEDARAAARRGESILILGEHASGKTSLACACLHAVIELGRGAKASHDDRCRAARSRYESATGLSWARFQWGYGKGEAPAIESACRASCLVIDALGTIEKDLASLQHVIRYRGDHRKQTIVTTVLRLPEIVDRYGDDVAACLLSGRVINISAK